MDWIVIAIAAVGALVLGRVLRGRAPPGDPPARAAGVPGRQRPARLALLAALGADAARQPGRRHGRRPGRGGACSATGGWPSPSCWPWSSSCLAERLVRRQHGRPPQRPPAPGHQRAGRHPARRRRADAAGPASRPGTSSSSPRSPAWSPTTSPCRWSWLPHLLVVLVMVGRVYVGAHNPLDVTAGLGTGLLVGSLLDLFLR